MLGKVWEIAAALGLLIVAVCVINATWKNDGRGK